jgi:hypothetical protein
MPLPIENAISQLQEEMEAYGQGTQKQPKEGTTEWYLLRCCALGISYLRRIQELGVVEDPAAAERLYRKHNDGFKKAVVPAAPMVVKEAVLLGGPGA